MDPHHRTIEAFDTNAPLMTEAAALENARDVYIDAPVTAVLVRYGEVPAANPGLAASAWVQPRSACLGGHGICGSHHARGACMPHRRNWRACRPW